MDHNFLWPLPNLELCTHGKYSVFVFLAVLDVTLSVTGIRCYISFSVLFFFFKKVLSLSLD